MPQSYASLLTDSISPEGYRLTSFEWYYPRYILAEVNTHGMLSRSTASSRAIPFKKRLEQVRNDPYVPARIGLEQPGMQSSVWMEGDRLLEAQDKWRKAARSAADAAEEFAATGAHKQQANRLLEPYVFVHTVITGTEWENFFGLRVHPDADPEFYALAAQAQAIWNIARPTPVANWEWHLPYITEEEDGLDPLQKLRVSAARCARVSYRMHDGAKTVIEKDLALAKRLIDSKHMSPFNHQAQALDTLTFTPEGLYYRQRNLIGWKPFRVDVEEQAGIKSRRFLPS